MCCDGISEEEYALEECPECDGIGCDDCEDGYFRLTQCARVYVSSIVRAVNMATIAEHHLPAAGGLLDQSQWFMHLWNAVSNEQNRIDAERIKKH